MQKVIAKNRLSNSYGMTLMEILIVMAIVASLMAVLLPTVMDRYNKSKVNSTKLAMNQLISSINLYYTDCGKYPDSMENLTTQDSSCSNWGPEAYVKKIPKDSWNRDLLYSAEGGNFVVKSLGSDGREGGEGYAKDINSEELQ
ncbi:MAG: type II secretion system protein GspG [Pseudobdellovibrionaceae bacterium]